MATASSSDYGVAGFDSDLLDPKLLARHLKNLPRESMIAALQRASLAIRVNALEVLKQHGGLGQGEVWSVAVLLRDESPSIRAAAARTLAAATDPVDAVPKLCFIANDSDEVVAREAARSIESFGHAALPHLMLALSCDSDDADAKVLPHILRFGEKARAFLLEGLTAGDERVRANSIAGLMGLGATVLVDEIAQIQPLLADPATVVRDIARQAMNANYRHSRPAPFAPDTPPIATFGSQSLTDAELKTFAKYPLASLLEFAKDGRKIARLDAWRCIDAHVTKLDDYTTALALVAQKDGEAKVRARACAVLRKCPDHRLSDVLHGLTTCAMDPDKDVVDAAWDGFDAVADRSLEPLILHLGERDQDRAETIVHAIARHGAKAGKLLEATLTHIGPIERWNALLALIEIGSKTLSAAHPKIVGMLREPFDATRATVVRALGKLPKLSKANPDIVEALEHMLEFDASLVVRTEADKALRAIHGA